MSAHRSERVAELVLETVSDLIAREVHDPRIRVVHLTGARMSPDLHHVTLSFSVLSGAAPEREAATRALQRAAAFLRLKLGRRLSLRVTPELHFRADESADHADHIERVLAEIRDSSAADPAPPPSGEPDEPEDE